MGMSQAADGRGFDAGAMADGYAPMGDPAAAYAAMVHAQTAQQAQFPPMQMPFGAPAAGAGWHRERWWTWWTREMVHEPRDSAE